MNSGAGLGNLLVLALPLLLLAFLMFSQRRRGREIQAFQDALAVGDKVVMTSGLYGTVLALDPVAATLEIAPGVQVRVDRRAVGMKQPEAVHQDAMDDQDEELWDEQDPDTARGAVDETPRRPEDDR